MCQPIGFAKDTIAKAMTVDLGAPNERDGAITQNKNEDFAP